MYYNIYKHSKKIKNTEVKLNNNLKRIIVITGHYGSGKTNFAVNLAMNFKKSGEQNICLVDLDIVNPYFRSADFKNLLSSNEIDMIAPSHANTSLDTPSIPKEVKGVILSDKRAIIDLGGDDVGATALGRYKTDIEKSGGCDLLYLFSVYRPFTRNVQDVINHIADIERVTRQKVTHLVNSSNLGKDTTKQDIEDTFSFAKQLTEQTGIPLFANLAIDNVAGDMEDVYSVKLFVNKPWETNN